MDLRCKTCTFPFRLGSNGALPSIIRKYSQDLVRPSSDMYPRKDITTTTAFSILFEANLANNLAKFLTGGISTGVDRGGTFTYRYRRRCQCIALSERRAIAMGIHCDIANFCQKFDSVLFRIKKDNFAQPRTNGLTVSGHIELAFRGAVDLEIRR